MDEVKRQYEKHPYMPVIELTRIAQKLALPSDRRRTFTSVQSIEWINKFHDIWKRAQFEQDRPIFVEEVPKEEPKKIDLKELITELLADAMVQVVAEAIVKARQRLDLPIYGLFSSQINEVRNAVGDCYDLRFIQDVNSKQLMATAQWADLLFVMTKFVSHDYGAIKNLKITRYCNGAASALINELENLYLEENKE